ncbi:ATP-binding protein [Streptomyces sp. NBC_01237]|uniref:ATP-binding protein n=1 Tax=Streptomyces sp. NBC_01237 TaxID=2903790 RepID=UPI002DDAB1FC|nr:sensor histidine kinase [Streptomyces sp. NBC_01237]WRZ77188.1 sensor histidine kinase [Streptomyces sp. NBC_01237]
MILIQQLLGGVLLVALAVAIAVAVRMRRSAIRSAKAAAEARDELDLAGRAIAARDAEARHLAEDRLPGLLLAWQSGSRAPEDGGQLLQPGAAATATGIAFQSVVDQVRTMLEEAEARAEGAARSAVQATTRSLQILGYEFQVKVSDLISNVDDQELLARLMPVDHLASQLLRRLQVVGVLTGMWPGRQHGEAPLLDVARAGVGRIRDYQRVQVPTSLPYYLDGTVVEPLALLLSELMDNAARHSAPSTPVQVSVREVHNGLAVEIHDAGPGMTPETELRAERLLNSGEKVRLTDLGNPATFGLAGVATLCNRYGFHVMLDQQHSYGGGCRAVVLVPRNLLVDIPASPGTLLEPIPAASKFTTAPPAVGSPPPPAESGSVDRAPDGLPQRRRTARTPREQPTPPASPAPRPPGQSAGNALAAFARGTSNHNHPDDREEHTK